MIQPARYARGNAMPFGGSMADELQNEKLIHLFTTPIIKHVWTESEDLNEELRHIIINKTRGGKGTTYSAVGG